MEHGDFPGRQNPRRDQSTRTVTQAGNSPNMQRRACRDKPDAGAPLAEDAPELGENEQRAMEESDLSEPGQNMGRHRWATNLAKAGQ